MVEAARYFTGQFNVRSLVFAHGHIGRFVDEDVGRLQQRVAQKAIGCQIAIFQLFHLVFVGGHAL